MNTYSVSEVISALSYALDLTEGLPPGHSMGTCMIGMRLAQRVGLPLAVQAELYYALLLKDSGCSSNASRLSQILGSNEIAAKRMTKTEDWTRTSVSQITYLLRHAHADKAPLDRVRAIWKMMRQSSVNARELISLRCERGASIARRMGLSAGTAEAIHNLDEHWDGSGYPAGLRGEAIPLLARILNLAQNLEVFHAQFGGDAAIRMASERKARWFDPDLVKAAVDLARADVLWTGLGGPGTHALVTQMEPEHQTLPADQATLDNLCVTFADVIDAKSPFTLAHSTRVTQVASAIAAQLGQDDRQIQTIRRASLLHDVGKLSVPNSILEKPGALTAEEWKVVARHPMYTHQILIRISGFEEIAAIAAAHHEKLDGSGYHRGLCGKDLPLAARILAVADIYDAMAAGRPYREAMPQEAVLATIAADAPHKLDVDCVEALQVCLEGGLGTLPASSYLRSLYTTTAAPAVFLPGIPGSAIINVAAQTF